MTIPPPDGSRDRRIEDLSNLWIIHPAGRALLPGFVARGISANAVSVAGLVIGAGSALAYAHWDDWRFALLGLVLSTGWLIADGLDGMIARATGTASPLGRALDGLCDHGVFALLYVTLAWSVGTPGGWVLAILAGVAHAVQSNLYEGERARYHRRCQAKPITPPYPSANPLVRLYDHVAGTLDRYAAPFDAAMLRSTEPQALAAAYGTAAAAPLRLMRLLTANARVAAIFLACLIGSPRLFWWVEIVPMTIILLIGLVWHRAVESRLIRAAGISPRHARPSTPSSSQRT